MERVSKFLRVKCECGNEQNVFSNAATTVRCSVCSKLLAEPRGSKALVHGKIVRVMS
ncbi:MAG: 30S ribosomal protein S27e [Candidatus Micrarchaeia archaeon]